jgi:ribosomal protein L37E
LLLDEYDDEFSRDSLSEFSNVTLNDQEGRGHKREPQDDLSTVTRKRTFSSSDPHSTDGDANANGKSEKRTATKICRVCGDKAYSYNFSVVTCESCKAFFRRNANKDKDIRCPFNDNCDINIVSRRFCQKCRLAKCFKVGMKKEWIMTDEARQEKKKRIQDNRERRMAERAQEEAMLQHKQMAIPPQTNGASLDSASTQIITNSIQLNPPPEAAIVQPQLAQNMPPLGTLNPGILPALPQASAITTIIPSEPQTVMQQVIQQAQQVQK